jgi:hypothetical protein
VPYLELEAVESSTAEAWPPTARFEVEEGGGYPIWSWRWVYYFNEYQLRTDLLVSYICNIYWTYGDQFII